MEDIHRIICLSGELIRFMSVFSHIRFAEVLCLVGLSFRIPRSSYDGAVSCFASLFDVFRAVEAVACENILVHAHFTRFLHDESAFLIKAGNCDDIRVCCLNLGQLSGEVGIFICEGFICNDFETELLAGIQIELVFTDHLVIVVGVHDSDLLEAQFLLCFFYHLRDVHFARDRITEYIIADFSDFRAGGAGAEDSHFGLLGDRVSSHRFTGGHRAFDSEDFILFDALLHSVDGFILDELGIIHLKIDLDLGVRILVNFLDCEFRAFLHSDAVSRTRAGISGDETEFYGFAGICAAGSCFLISAAACECTCQCCCCHNCCHSFEPFFLHNFLPLSIISYSTPKNRMKK